MKTIILAVMVTMTAQASIPPLPKIYKLPQLYCQSTQTFDKLVGISIYTNSNGLVRFNGEINAKGGFLADTGNILTLVDVKYNPTMRTLTNDAQSVELMLDRNFISADEAIGKLPKFSDEEGSYFAGSGFKYNFKKYRMAYVRNFKVNAPKGSYKEILNKAFAKGVKTYVCGDVRDIVKK